MNSPALDVAARAGRTAVLPGTGSPSGPGGGRSETVTEDGLRLVRDGLRLTFELRHHGRVVPGAVDFLPYAGVPVVPEMVDFVSDGAGDVAAGTSFRRARDLLIFAEFLRASDEPDVTPRVYRDFLRWLHSATADDGSARFGPDAVASVANLATRFYEFGIDRGATGWTEARLDTMLRCRAAELRGLGVQAAERSLERAVSLEEYEGLLHASRLELEACRAAREEARRTGRTLGVGASLDPNPFVVFALYAALLHGVRAQELNELTIGDVDPAAKTLHLRAPDKPERVLPISPLLLEVLELCLLWGAEARREGGGAALLVYVGLVPRRRVVRVTAETLNHRALPRFYTKYHVARAVDPRTGADRPILADAVDPAVPFYSDYRKLRNAAIRQWTETESNVQIVQAMADHQNRATTYGHYTHIHRRDHRRKMAVALGPDAEIVAAALQNRITLGLPDEITTFARAGADLPLGGCAAARCDSPGHCLDCRNLVIQISKRANIAREQEVHAERAREFEGRGQLRDAENARRIATLATAQLRRVDSFLRGRSDLSVAGETPR